jgi:HNH endonuclease
VSELTQELVQELFELDEVRGVLLHRKSRQKVRVGEVAGGPSYDGSWRIFVNGKLHNRARIIFLYLHGYLPYEVRHRNRNELDDRPSNLRPATEQSRGNIRGSG